MELDELFLINSYVKTARFILTYKATGMKMNFQKRMIDNRFGADYLLKQNEDSQHHEFLVKNCKKDIKVEKLIKFTRIANSVKKTLMLSFGGEDEKKLFVQFANVTRTQQIT